MQAEACFEAYLTRSKNYKLLAANVQIQGETETLGELDYIVKNLNTNRIIHIELACKFYLYDVDTGTLEEERWIGPNRKDSLYDKLEKIKLKQFPLLFKNETIEKLKALNVEIPTTQELCLKAFLFLPKPSLPIGRDLKRSSLPTNYANCIAGHWINLNDFSQEDKSALYAIPSKKEWFLPLESITEWYSYSEIQERIAEQLQNRKSPLIYKRTLQEIERFFVVWW